jgi:hypothetical protein
MAIKNLSALKKILKGFDIDAIITAATSTEEVEITIPEGTFLTTADLTARDENIKTTNINVGKELLIKELKTESGLDYSGEGSKDPKRFLNEYKKKVSAELGKSEEEKVTELNKVVEGLRKNLEKEQKEKGDLITKQKESSINQKFLEASLDKKPESFTNDEWVAILKMGIQVEEVDGIEVVKKGGEIIKDPVTLKPLDTKTAISNYIEERKIGKVIQHQQQQGRGGQDSKHPPSGITSMKQFKEHIKTLNISENGAQAVSLLKEISGLNPNFDFSVKE